MKLYYAPGACSLSPHIVAREAGLPVELVRVDTKTHRTESGADYYQVNRLGYVPVLEMDDGALLREGAVIVQFLADRAPQARLLPPVRTMDRLRVQEWLNFIATEYHKQFIPLLRGAPQEVLVQQREKVGQALAELERQLGMSEYLAGDHFTVTDAYAFAITRWCSLDKVRLDLESYPRVRAFMARTAGRPAVREALQAEGLAP